MHNYVVYLIDYVYLYIKKNNYLQLRPYYKSELAQAYAPNISSGAALNRLATWIKTNPQLTEALKETNYRVNQQLFTSRQVALIFEYLGEP